MTETTNNPDLTNSINNSSLAGLMNADSQSAHRIEQTIADSLRHLLSQQGYSVDNVRMQDVIQRYTKSGQKVNNLAALIAILNGVGVEELPEVFEQPDAAFLPLLAYHADLGWGIIDQQTPQGLWSFDQAGKKSTIRGEDCDLIVRIRLKDDHIKQRQFNFTDLLKKDLSNYKGIVVEAVIASFVINFLALAVSLFSMQVYDRVIPTNSRPTLIILASGVGLVIIFEAFMKFTRSKIMDRVVVGLDQYLSREVFQRLLKVRIDQMPGSVGTMAAQLRGYEQVRGFFTASTLFGLVDLPMSIIFISLIAYIGSPLVAIVPIVAACIALIMGLFARKRIDEIAAEGAAASYYKTGLLVETVEGVETIKAGSGSWKFLSRWLDVMDITVKNDLDMKHANDYLSYFTQMLQQISYVGIVIMGSFVVMKQDMTMGGLIACSILGGRILAPVMAIPGLLVQYAHAKAAKKNIDSLFDLEQDNHGVNYPLSPTRINGVYQCDNLVFNYLGNDRPAVSIKRLVIRPGERIAILGPIGSGKSTLLKLLSGLYAPTQGRILLDGLDIQQISREALSEQVGYLQQDHRLFQGTLRENLLIGMAAPNDDVLHDAMKKTGLINLVANHSSGLDLPISEGGRGLSGGQKQLVAFTRLLLTKPSVLLLDEPTASMDNRQEQRCLQVLNNELQEGQTLVVSTHKTALLDLVDRLIIMDNQQIVMDGPKQAVLNKLMENEKAKIANSKPTNHQPSDSKGETTDGNESNNLPTRTTSSSIQATTTAQSSDQTSFAANSSPRSATVNNTSAQHTKQQVTTEQKSAQSAENNRQVVVNNLNNKKTPTSSKKPIVIKPQQITINQKTNQSSDQLLDNDVPNTNSSGTELSSDKTPQRPNRQPVRIQPVSEE